MSVIHSGFTITRDIAAPVERTFAAFADRQQKKAWFTDGPAWDTTEDTFDFRVGGVEIAEGQFHGGPLSRFVATFTDIVENERIVLTYDMWLDGSHISTSVASYEFTCWLSDARTRLLA